MAADQVGVFPKAEIIKILKYCRRVYVRVNFGHESSDLPIANSKLLTIIQKSKTELFHIEFKRGNLVILSDIVPDHWKIPGVELPLQPIPMIPMKSMPQTCSACGITLSEIMGYVCARRDCPTGLNGPQC